MEVAIRRLGAALACALALGLAHSAPFTPQRDSDVVERLPLSASDPSVRRIDSLRKQLAARPDDAPSRIEIARRYFDLAMAQGDPRYVGYAISAIAPLATRQDAAPGYWVVRGMLQQYSHDFDAALASLAKAEQADPSTPEPMAWEAAIHMVQAHYPQAQQACERLALLAQPLFGAGCIAYVRAATGELEASYATLTQALAQAKDAAPELQLWELTRVAEMALRLGRPDQAEQHFRRALGLGVTDQFLLGAYADFLLESGRPAEVLKLLTGWERSDILLLRLALAGKATRDAKAAEWATQLRDRFQAAAQRGDRLHEQEAARFELDVEGQPAKALALASRNYTVQKEPRDAEILMRTAVAGGDAKAAQPALDWLRTNRYQDPRLDKLAQELAAKGATR